ncbi:MAG: hypothetical protein ABI321_22405 [Polyangia bacterium]
MPTTSTYAVEVVGIGDEAPPATEFTAVALDSSTGNLTLDLPIAAQVSGHVSASTLAVPGTVVFSRPSRVPGRSDVSYQASVDGTGAYSLDVPPNLDGETYTVRFRPTDTTSYVPYSSSVSITADATVNVALPTGAELLTLHGTLTDAVKVAVTGARVVLRDGVTQTDLSSTSVTDDQGQFNISIPATATNANGSLLLLIQRGDATSGLVTVSIQLAASQLGNAITQAEYMQLALPALPAASHLTFTVLGAGSSGTNKPVAGASVQLVTTLQSVDGRSSQGVMHEVDGQTAADGTLGADLYSNAQQSRVYTVTVVPPADSDFQSTTQTVVVSTASGYTQAIMLGLRPLVTGRIVGPDRVPLKGALLSPSASFVISGSTTNVATPGSATTDGTGRFALHVDAAEYDLGLSPPASASLPRTWVSRQSITGDVDLGDLALPYPVTFDAVVRGGDHLPVMATVRVYLVPAADPTCDAATSSCTPTPLLQAEGATGKDGKASLLLPAD